MKTQENIVVLIAGYRFAGKSLVLQHLEQAGYTCVDNLPPRLVPDYLSHRLRKRRDAGGRVALALDAGHGDFVDGVGGIEAVDTEELELILALRAKLADSGFACKLVFIGASETALSERHAAGPRQRGDGAGNPALLREAEREAFAAVSLAADLVIDSSWLSPVEERDRIVALAEGKARVARTVVELSSFGYKFGAPQGDVIVDLRFIPNPYYVAALRRLTGKDADCAGYVFSHGCARETLAALVGLVTAMEPAYVLQGRPLLRIRIGCTGGQHRSVAMVEALGAALSERGLETRVMHRELEGKSQAEQA